MGFGCAVQAAAGGMGGSRVRPWAAAVAVTGNRAWPWAAASAAGMHPSARLQPCGARVRCGVMGCDCAGHGCEGHEPEEGVIMCGGSD